MTGQWLADYLGYERGYLTMRSFMFLLVGCSLMPLGVVACGSADEGSAQSGDPSEIAPGSVAAQTDPLVWRVRSRPRPPRGAPRAAASTASSPQPRHRMGAPSRSRACRGVSALPSWSRLASGLARRSVTLAPFNREASHIIAIAVASTARGSRPPGSATDGCRDSSMLPMTVPSVA